MFKPFKPTPGQPWKRLVDAASLPAKLCPSKETEDQLRPRSVGKIWGPYAAASVLRLGPGLYSRGMRAVGRGVARTPGALSAHHQDAFAPGEGWVGELKVTV